MGLRFLAFFKDFIYSEKLKIYIEFFSALEPNNGFELFDSLHAT